MGTVVKRVHHMFHRIYVGTSYYLGRALLCGIDLPLQSDLNSVTVISYYEYQ